MGKDKRGLGDVEFAGKVKTQTFKQFQLDQLIKNGTVIPASKLVEVRDLELKRVREFEASIEDEERHRRASVNASEGRLKNLPLTRERFEE
jgi:hypothetical protein